MGVYDRIQIIKDKKESKSPANRPEYVYQIPLSFIPGGFGSKTIEKMLNHFRNRNEHFTQTIFFDDLKQLLERKMLEIL